MTNLDSILKSRDITLQQKSVQSKQWFFQWSCMDVTVGLQKKAEHRKIDAFELQCWRRLLRVPWTARISNQFILKKSVMNIHWTDWCWSWSSNTLATWCEELTHLNRPWCLEKLKAGGEGNDRGWDSWISSPTQWTWVWVNSESWRSQGGLVCCSPCSCRVGHNWVIELNWMAFWTTSRKQREECNLNSHHPGSPSFTFYSGSYIVFWGDNFSDIFYAKM